MGSNSGRITLEAVVASNRSSGGIKLDAAMASVHLGAAAALHSSAAERIHWEQQQKYFFGSSSSSENPGDKIRQVIFLFSQY